MEGVEQLTGKVAFRQLRLPPVPAPAGPGGEVCPTPPTAHQSMTFHKELDPTSTCRVGVAAADLAVFVGRELATRGASRAWTC
jgi:hypothetical protein